MSGSIKLALQVSGQVGKLTVGPFEAIYDLQSETAGMGPQEVRVPPSAPPRSIDVTLQPMAEQSLLFICSDEDVIYELNDDGQLRKLNKLGFVVLPGDPVISVLTFGGNGVRTATVTIIQLGSEGLAPPVGATQFILDNVGPATASQTVFALAKTPEDPDALMFLIEGIEYSKKTGFFIVSGLTLTWLPGAPGSFVMPAGARTEAYYR